MYLARSDAPDDPSDRDRLLWPDVQSGPWQLAVAWVDIDGRPECIGLEIRSYRDTGEHWPPELPHWSDDPSVLTASTLRRLPLGEILDDLRRARATELLDIAHAFERDDADEFDRGMSTLMRQRSGTWADSERTATTHRQVAAVYTAAWRNGQSPTKAVAEHFTISRAAAAKRVARARDAGLLPQTKRGMPQIYGEADR